MEGSAKISIGGFSHKQLKKRRGKEMWKRNVESVVTDLGLWQRWLDGRDGRDGWSGRDGWYSNNSRENKDGKIRRENKEKKEGDSKENKGEGLGKQVSDYCSCLQSSDLRTYWSIFPRG